MQKHLYRVLGPVETQVKARSASLLDHLAYNDDSCIVLNEREISERKLGTFEMPSEVSYASPASSH